MSETRYTPGRAAAAARIEIPTIRNWQRVSDLRLDVDETRGEGERRMLTFADVLRVAFVARLAERGIGSKVGARIANRHFETFGNFVAALQAGGDYGAMLGPVLAIPDNADDHQVQVFATRGAYIADGVDRGGFFPDALVIDLPAFARRVELRLGRADADA